jgi:maltooligosyltrehalose trehalohydrolase
MSPDFAWDDNDWKGIPLNEYVLYEVHVGTFTPEGTFDAMLPRLPALKELGINNIEIMPVSQFPGARNWGYDGVLPFAVQSSYGGPEALKRLVDACHYHGISVTLDVVYNHFGPEGNYLREFGPYFTHKYRTPWGDALNFDDEFNDHLRYYFIQNALYWLKEFHIDALRLDAVHAIYDMSAVPFLQELAEEVDKLSEEEGKERYLIAESDLNDSRLLRPISEGGYGLHAQWSDDFHHALHSLLTGEREGYYEDFGQVEHLATAIKERFFYSWRYSQHRKRRHGSSAQDRPPEQFVVALQNHDQIGNRMLGERLSTLISFEAQKLGAGALLLSPYVPLLFMGQEYGEEAPFLYFVSHTEADLNLAVRKGRKEEFKAFAWLGEAPDPDRIETFHESMLDWNKRDNGKHRILLDLHRELLAMRRQFPALAVLDTGQLEVTTVEEQKFMMMKRLSGSSKVLCLFNFNKSDVDLETPFVQIEGPLRKRLDSADERWGGPGSSLPQAINTGNTATIKAESFAVYELS